MRADLRRSHKAKRLKPDCTEKEFEWSYLERILAIRRDSTGQGDIPMEVLQSNTSLPVGAESHVQFMLQSKNLLYTNVEAVIFGDEDGIIRFSYPADHPLTAEFEEQMTRLLREYKGDSEYLSVHHSDEPDARDDGPDATALALMGASGGGIGSLLFL